MKKDERQQPDFRRVTSAYQLCFMGDCPQHEACLRYLAGQHRHDGRSWGPAVYPSARREDGTCTMFKSREPVRMAWGFEHIFDEVKRHDFKPMREALMRYLGGHGTYYLYRNGGKPLRPEQQEFVRRLFRRYGYDAPVEFRRYSLSYDFD